VIYEEAQEELCEQMEIERIGYISLNALRITEWKTLSQIDDTEQKKKSKAEERDRKKRKRKSINSQYSFDSMERNKKRPPAKKKLHLRPP